jgi:hypothetical protein
MFDRSFFATAGWVLASVVAGGALAVDGCKSAPPPPPAASPAATTLAPERPPDAAVAAATTMNAAPASGSPKAPTASAPTVVASASPSPSPDAAEAERAEQEQRVRAEVAAAKAKAESLTATANAECPDLKPGELRHPGAVSRCRRLHDEAAEAVNQYELRKKEALAAGITVQ